jgi:hypothetical protein
MLLRIKKFGAWQGGQKHAAPNGSKLSENNLMVINNW